MKTRLCTEQTSSHAPDRSNAEWLLRAEEIAAYSADASTAVERRRWHVLRLLAAQTPIADIVAATGYGQRTIRQVAQRYREYGPAGLADGRQRSAGAAPMLSIEQQRELRQALQGPPSEGSRWTGPKVARWIAVKTGRHVHRQRGWEYLRRLKSTRD